MSTLDFYTAVEVVELSVDELMGNWHLYPEDTKLSVEEELERRIKSKRHLRGRGIYKRKFRVVQILKGCYFCGGSIDGRLTSSCMRCTIRRYCCRDCFYSPKICPTCLR